MTGNGPVPRPREAAIGTAGALGHDFVPGRDAAAEPARRRPGDLPGTGRAALPGRARGCRTPGSDTAFRRSATRRHGRRPGPGDRRRPGLGRARQAVHHRRHRPRPGQDVGTVGHRRSSPSCSACSPGSSAPPVTARRTPPVAFATLAGRERGRAVRPGPHHRPARLARRARRRVRERRAVEAPVVLPAAASGRQHRGPGTPRWPANVRPPGTNVAFMDGSTLGKIDVQGPDAAQFLDLLYTNLMSSLKVGAIRYGVMCGVDGMVIDDGTVFRLGDAPLPGHHHHRQRGDGAGLDGGVAADRVAAAAGVVHLGHRAVGHHGRGRAPLPRAGRVRWPPVWPSATTTSRS